MDGLRRTGFSVYSIFLNFLTFFVVMVFALPCALHARQVPQILSVCAWNVVIDSDISPEDAVNQIEALIRPFGRIRSLETGPTGMIYLSAKFNTSRYSSPVEAEEAAQALANRVDAIPGVIAVCSVEPAGMPLR